MRRLVINGEEVYELDETCLRKKKKEPKPDGEIKKPKNSKKIY